MADTLGPRLPLDNSPPCDAMQTDFFTSSYGNIQQTGWRRYGKLLRMLDALCDARLSFSLRRALRAAAAVPAQRILLAAVQVPGRERDLQELVRLLERPGRHPVTASIIPMDGRGKCDNINLALRAHDLSRFDWVLLLDDDVVVPDHFLDLFVYFCWREQLQLAMPAHRFYSHKSFGVTERHWGAAMRRTGFVEIGPLTLIHATLFSALIPFPSLRFGWGLDVLWSQEAKRRGWRLGVVDATPIRHLRPVAQSYSGNLAMEEGRSFLKAQNVTLARADMLGPGVKVR